jgi:hypothetical protein
MNGMKFGNLLTPALFLAVVVAWLLSPLEVKAQEHTCQIKAGPDNVYIFVRDMDRGGNPTRSRIFKGWILQGRTISIKSHSGLITYDYKADSDYRGSGSNESVCTDNRTITVP